MIEYSITICGAMNQTELKELELVQNNVLRIATESFRSAPEIRITNVIKKIEGTQLAKILEKQDDIQLTIKTINLQNY